MSYLSASDCTRLFYKDVGRRRRPWSPSIRGR